MMTLYQNPCALYWKWQDRCGDRNKCGKHILETDTAHKPDPFAKKLERFLSRPSDRLLLAGLIGGERHFCARKELANPGNRASVAYVLRTGWACVYKLLPDGSRQVIDFRLPGDFIGLVPMLMYRLDWYLETITDVTAWEISGNKLLATLPQSPALGEAMLWSFSRDVAILSEHIVNIGGRGALAGTAHLLLELGHRLTQVGQCTKCAYELPLTQKDLAEALGITSIHLNRVLRSLRDSNLIGLNGHMVVLRDVQTLTRIADFDHSYLDA